MLPAAEDNWQLLMKEENQIYDGGLNNGKSQQQRGEKRGKNLPAPKWAVTAGETEWQLWPWFRVYCVGNILLLDPY
jgi:hypothetical protein